MKYLKINILLFLCLLLAACSLRPKNVLSPEKMVDILVDLHRLDGTLQIKHRDKNYNQDDDVYFYEAILFKHGVTVEQFDASMAWYTAHPKRFEKVYPKVIQRLKVEQDVIVVYNDSLKKLKAIIRKNNLKPYNFSALYEPYTREVKLMEVELPKDSVFEEVTIPYLSLSD